MAAIQDVPSPLNVGIENSRRFRGLPMFSALMSMGREGYEDVIRRNVRFARALGKWMTDTSDTGGGRWYEVMNATELDVSDGQLVVPLNVVLFRARARSNPPVTADADPIPADFDPSLPDGLSSTRLVQAINATRAMYVSPAKNAVRLAVSNWMTGLRKNDEGKGDYEIVTETLKHVMLAASP